MQYKRLTALAAITVLLAACGGGGGDAVDQGTPTPTPPGEQVTVNVNGTAAKGRVGNARVSAHAVGTDGSMSGTALAVTGTDGNGGWRLSFNAPKGQPFVLVVSGQPADSALPVRHEDEIAGAQQLPARFRMRAALQASENMTTTVTITPFSEMAVAAAQKASGGLNTANVNSGNAVVRQLLGFDPTRVAVRTSPAGASLDEQKLQVMLTALSHLANTSDVGCASGNGAEKVTCVVEKLAGSATTSSLQLNVDGSNLGQKVAAAVEAVLQQPRFAGSVSRAVLATLLANLRCVGDGCKPVPPPAGNNPVAEGIAAAKALVTQLKSDLTALFVSGTTANVGDLRTQADKFSDAMEAIQPPAEMLVRDTGALVLGIDLYNDYKAGRTTQPSRGRAQGEFASTGPEPTFGGPSGVGCTLFQDNANTMVATSPANANSIGCSARFFVDFNTMPPTEYVHAFSILPTATSGQFTYSMRPRSRQQVSPGQRLNDVALQSTARTGTVTVALDSGGHISSFAATGGLGGAFEMGDRTLVSDHHDWTVNGSRSGSATGTATVTLTATVTVKDAGNATQGTLTVRSGSLSQVPDTNGGTKVSAAALDIQWTTAKAEFQGAFSLGDVVASKDKAREVPTRLSLSGAFTNVDGSTRTEFASGTFTVAISGYAAYNAAQADSSSNFFSADATFTGAVTAPGRPLLRLTLASGMKSFEEQPALATLQYRSFASGTPRSAVDITVTTDSAGTPTVALAETSAGLSMKATRGAASADLMLNGTTKIGVLNLDTGILTFTDGSFVSTDLTP